MSFEDQPRQDASSGIQAEESPIAKTELGRGEETTQALPLRPMRLTQKLLYGAGESGEAVKNTALQTFLLFYYVQILGMPGALCGLALLLGLLLDGAIDPLVGLWSDRTRSRFGRRHPFLYAAPVPLAICLFLVFSPPHGWSSFALFAWLLAFSLLGRISMTLYYIPHMALGAELAERFNERLALASYRMLFTQVGTLICLGGGFMLFFVPTDHYANGQLNQDAYTPFALFCGSIVVLTVLSSAIGTQDRALAVERRGGNAPTSDKMTPSMFAARISGAFKTKNFRRLLFTLLIIGLFSGTQNVIALHLNTYFWEFTPRDSQFSFYAQILGFFLGLPFSRSLANTFDKKGALFLCVGASCTLACVPVCLRLLGWFPPNGDPMVLVWVSLARGAFGFLGTTSIVLIQAMLADTADEYELSQGVRAQGLLFGAQSFSSKASSGAGAALGGLILDLIHFPRPPIVRDPSPEVLTKLGFAYGPLLLTLLFLGLLNMLRYDLTRARHAAILVELRTRRTPSSLGVKVDAG